MRQLVDFRLVQSPCNQRVANAMPRLACCTPDFTICARESRRRRGLCDTVKIDEGAARLVVFVPGCFRQRQYGRKTRIRTFEQFAPMVPRLAGKDGCKPFDLLRPFAAVVLLIKTDIVDAQQPVVSSRNVSDRPIARATL